MRERSPVPCAQPSPRGDAPSPLAFAKSCKGGDVSVLDPALAWDDRFIYLFSSLAAAAAAATASDSRIGCWHSRGYAYTASRAWAVKRDHAPSQDSTSASLLDRQTWWSRVTNVGPVRHRAIDSSELRLTTDREGRQVGQHRSHIVAAVSSAWLIARAAASGSQGRIVSSLSPGRPRADVGLSAVWSDLSAVSTTDQVGDF